MAWGEACCPQGGLAVPIPIPADSPWVAAGGEAQRALPGTASSQQVSGLRLGQRYTFTIRPLLGSAPGAETSVSERPGTAGCRGMMRGGDGPVLVAASPLPLAVCRDARGDIVFLVHGTRDSSSGADAVRSLLSNTVTALGRLGPDGTQVRGCRGGGGRWCHPCPFWY